MQQSTEIYRANFLWPHRPDSIEEAAYEFVNANTEEYRKQWWDILRSRIRCDAHDGLPLDQITK